MTSTELQSAKQVTVMNFDRTIA